MGPGLASNAGLIGLRVREAFGLHAAGLLALDTSRPFGFEPVAAYACRVMPVRHAPLLIHSRCAAISRYHERTGIRRAQLDISGGVDSAVMLGLLTKALGAEHITAVYSSIQSSQDSLDRARAVTESLKVKLIELDLSSNFDALIDHMVAQADVAGFNKKEILADIQKDPSILGSIRSCLRAPIGRGLNRMTGGGIRHGTGNECEDRFIRFYQKGGDGEVDTNPIEMLSKGEVYQVAHALDLPQSILTALPSPDLHGNAQEHNDEDELRDLTGVHWTYSRIDPKTGEYSVLGTIEAMSRFLDRPGVSTRLFATSEINDSDWQELAQLALAHEFQRFGEGPGEMLSLLKSARRLEATSRHKYNPNVPSLGSRAQLLISGALSDELPDLPLGG